MGPSILKQEGVAGLWTCGLMRDGPFPVHYEPFEAPVANVVFPKIKGTPAARIFAGDLADLGTSDEFPQRGDELPASVGA